MKFVFFNQNYLKDIIISKPDYKQAIENHRLLPSIDDDGNINGSMLLFNHKWSRHGIWQITDNIQIIENNEPKEDAQALLNSYLFVTEKSDDIFSGYSSDGILIKDIRNEILVKQINKTAHIYDIISLDNSNL